MAVSVTFLTAKGYRSMDFQHGEDIDGTIEAIQKKDQKEIDGKYSIFKYFRRYLYFILGAFRN